MNTLICGSIAYDSIMLFEDRFKNHIISDQIHNLNVAFLVPYMRREFGGCAGNIAYTLHLLGGKPVVMATVGEDHKPYTDRMMQIGLSTDRVTVIPDVFTAQAFITTDLDDNQITSFHPGAMSLSHQNHIADVDQVSLGIVAPDGRDGMIQHAREFYEAGIPFVFDPGQGLPMFNREELLHFVTLADYAAMNDYEAKMLEEKTGRTLPEIAGDLKALIVTRGGGGSTIYVDGEVLDIPLVAAKEVVDPTGCGDSYRAGLLYGIQEGLDWGTTGRLASLLGAIKIESRGPQNHQFDRTLIEIKFKESFGRSLGW
ncbi:MAG: carbohydrate kinase family protein [Proteobacteria bacterium]|nr:carbohydrate kinase family protein [Pseudomonadota bacterium]MDA1331493.1 carbohydrate kinase family protein [Pseudomonadota bacterium]